MVLPAQQQQQDPVYERISFGDSKTSSMTSTDQLLSPQEPVYESISELARDRLLPPQDDEPVYEAVYEILVHEDFPIPVMGPSSLLAPAPQQQQQNQQPNLDSMLGSLQSTMSKQGVATVTKGTCAGCNKPIIGQVGLPFLI